MFNYFELNNPTDFQYLLNSAGQDILINGNPARALITNTNLTESRDNKKITTLEKIERGFLIDYDDLQWLIVSDVSGKRYGKYKGIMQVINYNVKFNFSGIIKEFPSIVVGKVFDIDTGQYIALPTGKILVTMQENVDTLQIELNQRFIKMGSPWKVTGIDRTKKGLVSLSCEKDLFNQNDDKVNEIADYWAYTDRYTITILDTNPITLNQGATYQLNVEIRKNDIVDNTIPVVYSSDNPSVTVDSTGLITAVSPGTATITVSKADDASVSASISVNVQNISISIDGASDIYTASSYTYTCSVNNNGTIDNSAVGIWSIDYNGYSTSVASLSATTGNSVTLTTGSSGATIYLEVKWQNDESVTARKQITITVDGGGWL